MSQDWIDDCKEFWGKVLTGKYGHWCNEWDGLPIDETCQEFKCCNCFVDTAEIRKIKEELNHDTDN